MKKKSILLTVVSVVVLIAASLTLTACYGAGLTEGINPDDRKFSASTDERKFGDAPEYEGYIFKKGGEAMNFRIKCPSNAEEGKVYPIVIFLHGMGDNGKDNTGQMYRSLITSIDKYVEEECYVLLPQTIGDTDWTDENDPYSSGTKYGDLYNAMLDAVIGKYPIDTDRVYLTGMSMGGFGTTYQALTHPEKYAAIMPLCGGALWHDLSSLKDMPVWVAHSADDPAVNPVFSHYLYAELLRLGNTDVKATWYEDKGHQITQVFYDDPEVWEWLLSHRKIGE